MFFCENIDCLSSIDFLLNLDSVDCRYGVLTNSRVHTVKITQICARALPGLFVDEINRKKRKIGSTNNIFMRPIQTINLSPKLNERDSNNSNIVFLL